MKPRPEIFQEQFNINTGCRADERGTPVKKPSILFHATPARNLPSIMANGLDPHAGGRGAGSARVHLSESANVARAFVEALYREPVVVLAVNPDSLVLELGDDDCDGEWATSIRIKPDQIVVYN